MMFVQYVFIQIILLVNIMKDHLSEIKESIKTPDIFQRASDTITK